MYSVYIYINRNDHIILRHICYIIMHIYVSVPNEQYLLIKNLAYTLAFFGSPVNDPLQRLVVKPLRLTVENYSR